MDFRTFVELPEKSMNINHTDKILLMGSCFAENIGRLLMENKFDCEVNPYGVLYNPSSLLAALAEIIEGDLYDAQDLIEYKGYFHSFMHHSNFTDDSSQKCLEKINSRLQKAHTRFADTNVLILTFGTAYVYSLKENGKIVGNCHKFPAAFFSRNMLSVEEIVNSYKEFLSETFLYNPTLKVLFTVSPIRHLKDGMHGNQLSKSILLLSIAELKRIFPENVFYFPAYELLVDELRDYRFYAEDMVHPSKLAIDYVWECFDKCYFDKRTKIFLKEWKEIRNGLNHRPFRADSIHYKSFLKQLVLKIEALKEKYPNLDVDKELTLCHTLLKQ